MTTKQPRNGKPNTQLVRCAIYTRKSTEEGLEQAFNSLDAQRESGEALVLSQAQEGWTCLPQRYDDPGFSGGNMDRPALRRLLADIEAGQIDCVVVYKVDRLSRSLLDFAKMIDLFDQHHVAFVAVTQLINTSTSTGRLMLNVLLSFAQFEREIIGERTRDKIAATRRKGKWAGGHPILGYDVDPRGFRLMINEAEAERVLAIFSLYLEHEGLLPVVEELARRGWSNKKWQTRKGRERGGRPFTRTSLYRLLTNVAYIGRVKYKLEVHPGEHAGIVDPVVFQKVQDGLRRNAHAGGPPARGQFGALLKGLLRCAACDCAMTPSHTKRGNGRKYRYYTCSNAQKRGWAQCPSKSVPAGPIEQFVIDQVRCIGRDPAVLPAVLSQAREQTEATAQELAAEQRGLEKDLAGWHCEVQHLTPQIRPGQDNGLAIARLADLQERIRLLEERLHEVGSQIRAAQQHRLDEGEATRALALVDPVWEILAPREQARLIDLLVRQVTYDGARGKVRIAFHETGIQTLARELAQYREETNA
jgi:site-specific DNA recombinase